MISYLSAIAATWYPLTPLKKLMTLASLILEVMAITEHGGLSFEIFKAADPDVVKQKMRLAGSLYAASITA